MDVNQKYIARKLFQFEILKRNGQAYEDFFTSIMVYRFPEFKAVKPFGSLGDRKNDGFDEDTGKYYQVYAPENPSEALSSAIKKLNEDFRGLYDNWDKDIKIKEFYFVYNTKYKGIHPELTKELSSIGNEFNVKCYSFTPEDLEKFCFELASDQTQMVLGSIPSIDISEFDDIIMKEVIEHMLQIDKEYAIGSFPKNPDFDRKIEFNELSNDVSSLLKYASFSEADLKDYFRYTPDLKEQLRVIFSSLYDEGKENLNSGNSSSDDIFFYILDSATNSRTKPVRDAVLVLMSYYFSYCDIFEEPPSQVQSSLFDL